MVGMRIGDGALMRRDLSKRLDALTPANEVVVCIRQYGDQTYEQAVASHEQQHGPIPEGRVLRVIVRKFIPAPAQAANG